LSSIFSLALITDRRIPPIMEKTRAVIATVMSISISVNPPWRPRSGKAPLPPAIEASSGGAPSSTSSAASTGRVAPPRRNHR